MVMGLHPQYLSSFWKTQYLLLRMDGPLPYHKRHYIAIMAAARHQCSYLVGLHMGEFLQVGGNPAWLQGLHCAPQKLRNLNEINKLLAHRPWLITKEHIEALLKTGEHSWSLAELVQALVLLTHYHSLASFVFGCGINPEAEQDGGHGARPPSPHGDSSPASEDSMGCSGGKDALQEVEALMERMKLLQESQQEEEGVTQEEMATRFELEKTESLLVAPSGEVQGRAAERERDPCGLGSSGGEGVGVPTVGAGCGRLTAVPCRPGRALAAVQRPVLRGGPRVRLQGLHAAGRAGAPHVPCAGLHLGGPRLLAHQPPVPRRGAAPGREVPGGLQPHLQHHRHALRRRHLHAAPGHLELRPLRLRHPLR
ncbi:sestrin-2 isoform X1 [Oxyura jamaicensis]|uniref:sestrin-2 isoform X1 n=1 Tax=Oxyura jamaicensis TaxID=8884 RepID=UPI0015A64CC0|nr:sestrin-2 isoform X1 [Oxyura jamaicensis]